jgi:hypothetical protein
MGGTDQGERHSTGVNRQGASKKQQGPQGPAT